MKDESVSIENRQLILDFVHSMQAHSVKSRRLTKSIHILSIISRLLNKEFKLAEKKDIEVVFALIENSSYADWTKYDFKVVTKRFYKWLLGDDEEYPLCVKWIKSKEPKNHTLPEELITPEEIKKLIEVTDNPRDRALISLLYESGARIAELLSLKIKHIEFGEKVTTVLLDGKTGPRKIPVITSTPHLKIWLSFHPFRNNSNAMLWTKLIIRQEQGRTKEEALSYDGIRKLLQKLFAKISLKKDCNPHLFRHSRATFLAKHLTEAQLKIFFGWTQSSGMACRYVHMSGRDLNEVILNIQ